MYAKINLGVNFSLPSLGLYTCKIELKTAQIIQIITHKYYRVMLQKKEHVAMCAAERAIAQWSGKAHQPILLGKEIGQQLPL